MSIVFDSCLLDLGLILDLLLELVLLLLLSLLLFGDLLNIELVGKLLLVDLGTEDKHNGDHQNGGPEDA